MTTQDLRKQITAATMAGKDSIILSLKNASDLANLMEAMASLLVWK